MHTPFSECKFWFVTMYTQARNVDWIVIFYFVVHFQKLLKCDFVASTACICVKFIHKNVIRTFVIIKKITDICDWCNSKYRNNKNKKKCLYCHNYIFLISVVIVFVCCIIIFMTLLIIFS